MGILVHYHNFYAYVSLHSHIGLRSNSAKLVEQSYLTLRDIYAALVLKQVEYKTLPDSTHDRPNNGLTIDRFRFLTKSEDFTFELTPHADVHCVTTT